MGKSFYTGTDEELRSGSRAFLNKISTDPGAFGLNPDLVAEYAALNAAYEAACMAAGSPARTPALTCNKRDAKLALKRMAADLAKKVTGTLSVSDADRIALCLAVRATPTPVPPPGPPHTFRATLQGDGSLELRWKCPNPRRAAGTIYEVWRRVGDAGAFEYLGRSGGKKRFVDMTLPVGAAGVTYEIRPVRSTTAGPIGQFRVPFGTGYSATTVAAMEFKPSRAAA